QGALDRAGIPYDYWDVRTNMYEQPGAPPTETLNLYPYAIWFTGYDWYAPITTQEADMLSDYLDNGGRLFLSSQDALYYQDDTPFSRKYLGVLDHTEDVTPTLTYGAGGKLAFYGQYPLTYPFRNFSDGLIPAQGSRVEIIDDSGWSSGLSNRGDNWKTVFFSYPFEALPEANRADMIEGITGWLGWLGQSEFAANKRNILEGETVNFTATLKNDGPEPVTAVYNNPLPAGLTLITGSLTGAAWDGKEIVWQGVLNPGEEYAVAFSGTVTQTVENTAYISLKEHGLTLRRPVSILVDAPDLSPSILFANPSIMLPDETASYVLLLQNGGGADEPTASAKWNLPAGLSIISPTLTANGGSINRDGHQVQWWGAIAAGQSITITVEMTGTPSAYTRWHSSTAIIENGGSAPIVRLHILEQRPWRLYFPIIFH
ncbi:MAG: DUF11 domain-containing protein, partial [Anaerolineales bacterium]|nr:DUF11 domain-containing protein [Anaerolineales bacterium]